jgi:hypothetical protein
MMKNCKSAVAVVDASDNEYPVSLAHVGSQEMKLHLTNAPECLLAPLVEVIS